MTPRPILVTGCPRSGTTWVGSVLAHGSRVAYIHEPFNPAYGRPFTPAPFRRQFEYITDESAPLFEPGLRQTLNFYYDLGHQLGRPQRLHSLKTWLAFRWHRWWGGWRPLVKDPIALLSAEWLAARFNMRVVVMVRHPGGFASSMKRHPSMLTPARDFLSQPRLMSDWLGPFQADLEASEHWSTLERAALQWRLLNWVADRYRSRNPDWIFVRHEDLCADPETGFARLFQQLEIPWNGAASRVLKRYSRPGNPAEVETTWDLVRDSRAVRNAWRARLSPEELELVRQRTADVASLFYGQEW